MDVRVVDLRENCNLNCCEITKTAHMTQHFKREKKIEKTTQVINQSEQFFSIHKKQTNTSHQRQQKSKKKIKTYQLLMKFQYIICKISQNNKI